MRPRQRPNYTTGLSVSKETAPTVALVPDFVTYNPALKHVFVFALEHFRCGPRVYKRFSNLFQDNSRVNGARFATINSTGRNLHTRMRK